MSSVESLVQRLSAEVAAATERVHLLKAKAAQYARGREERFQRFVALTERVESILERSKGPVWLYRSSSLARLECMKVLDATSPGCF